MEYEIRRTSDSYHWIEERPCIEATKKVIDGRTFWTIEINTLEELNYLAEKYGEIIISMGDTPSIEIYDDYRE